MCTLTKLNIEYSTVNDIDNTKRDRLCKCWKQPTFTIHAIDKEKKKYVVFIALALTSEEPSYLCFRTHFNRSPSKRKYQFSDGM